jgi:hypothetical protein
MPSKLSVLIPLRKRQAIEENRNNRHNRDRFASDHIRIFHVLSAASLYFPRLQYWSIWYCRSLIQLFPRRTRSQHYFHSIWFQGFSSLFRFVKEFFSRYFCSIAYRCLPFLESGLKSELENQQSRSFWEPNLSDAGIHPDALRKEYESDLFSTIDFCCSHNNRS